MSPIYLLRNDLMAIAIAITAVRNDPYAQS
jgi:hypothetical protein